MRNVSRRVEVEVGVIEDCKGFVLFAVITGNGKVQEEEVIEEVFDVCVIFLFTLQLICVTNACFLIFCQRNCVQKRFFTFIFDEKQKLQLSRSSLRLIDLEDDWKLVVEVDFRVVTLKATSPGATTGGNFGVEEKLANEIVANGLELWSGCCSFGSLR